MAECGGMKYPPFYLQPLPHPSRRNCWEAIKNAPDGMVVTIKEETRTQEQNRLLWPLLSLWAKHCELAVNGVMIHVTKEAWKVAHLADFRHQHGQVGQFALTPGGILIPMGYETHAMPKGEFGEFLTYLLAETAAKGMELPPRVDYSEWLGRCA